MREKRFKKRIIATLIVIAMTLLLVPGFGLKGGVNAAENASGKDKYSLDWNYNAATKTLTIKPYDTGNLYENVYNLLGRNNKPQNAEYRDDYTKAYGWYKLRNDIEHVVIMEGIENV